LPKSSEMEKLVHSLVFCNKWAS